MKGSTDAHGSDGPRKGLFRRSRRTDDEATSAGEGPSAAVATVDELARRMDELVAGGSSIADDPVRAEFDLQRAVIARANDIAATSASTPEHHTNPTSTTPTAPEAPVQQPTDSQDQASPAPQDDIEARLDAALQPVQAPAPTAGGAVTLDPTPAPAPAEQPSDRDAVLAPATSITSGGSPATAIGIDVERVVRAIEDEAAGIQHRIELELRTASERAQDILDRAESEAERIREHGQAQARVLLGEVEEIISEAQQTGEQILLRANEEAASLRADATSVLQQAQLEARTIVEGARRDGEQVLAEQRRLATVRAQEAMREQDRLKDQIRRLEERRRQVLESLEPLISQLTQMMPAGQQTAAPQNVVQLQRQQQPAQQG